MATTTTTTQANGSLNNALSGLTLSGPPGQPDISYLPDHDNYLARVERRTATETLTKALPPGFPNQISNNLVWDGNDLAETYDWNYKLTSEDLEEIESALQHFQSLDLSIGHVNQETFLLPKLHNVLRDISKEIHTGHGFKVVRGIPVTKHTREENIIIYAGISSHIAPIRGRQDFQYDGKPADVVLAHIKDLTGLVDASKIGAPAYTKDKQVFHTDVGDVIALFALGEAAEGGQSYLSSSWKVYNELAATRPDLIQTLSEPWAADGFGKSDAPYTLVPLLHHQPATSTEPERLIIQYARRSFTGYWGLPRSSNIPPITEAQAEALDALHFTAEKYAASLDFHQGDIQYVNNLSIFHARAGFRDSTEKQRHLVRLWLRDPKLAWQTPEPLQEHWDRQGHDDAISDAEVSDGSLKYTLEKGGNDSKPSYQEASGAPVERSSPLGYTVGPLTIIFLNVSMMIGTGVYSTPSAILKGTGSVGLSMIYWVLGFIISASKLAVYLEFASYFPNRSGSQVVYLEQSYPRPRWLFPTAFAFMSVCLSFTSGNAIVLAQYLFAVNGHEPKDWELKGVAVAGYTVAVLCVSFHTKFSFYFSNAIGIVKVLTLVFIAIAGLVVLGGNVDSVPNPKANFANSFEGQASAYGLTLALYRIIFSYAGFENAFNVVNEVKNPVKQIRLYGFISLFIVTILYIFANIAYFSAVPQDELREAKEIAASLFFTKVFGDSNAVRGLNFLIALSSFGNLIAVLLGSSRMIRECGRQGVLPWPRFWASTRPFGTPLGPYFIKWLVTFLMILAPPAGDAFNFITDLQVYPDAMFNVLLAVGLYLVRYRLQKLGLNARPEFKAWGPFVWFNILSNVYLLVMPWYPPEDGPYGGSVSFWYATYAVVGTALLLGCAVYYYLWIWAIPKLKGYRVRQEVLTLEDGAQSHRIIKVPAAEVAEWDASHDAVGRPLGRNNSETGSTSDRGVGVVEKDGSELRSDVKAIV
ncbi:high-affinity methionine permease [Podospora australis]|uniref:High-affinity methionine permease n=1 Tax=Podospora australis TaxID=1536484 RepID=A0AAN6WJH6_9PEZI|nr:high-affinity methionine permease [Podospora australis]